MSGSSYESNPNRKRISQSTVKSISSLSSGFRNTAAGAGTDAALEWVEAAKYERLQPPEEDREYLRDFGKVVAKAVEAGVRQELRTNGCRGSRNIPPSLVTSRRRSTAVREAVEAVLEASTNEVHSLASAEAEHAAVNAEIYKNYPTLDDQVALWDRTGVFRVFLALAGMRSWVGFAAFLLAHAADISVTVISMLNSACPISIGLVGIALDVFMLGFLSRRAPKTVRRFRARRYNCRADRRMLDMLTFRYVASERQMRALERRSRVLSQGDYRSQSLDALDDEHRTNHAAEEPDLPSSMLWKQNSRARQEMLVGPAPRARGGAESKDDIVLPVRRRRSSAAASMNILAHGARASIINLAGAVFNDENEAEDKRDEVDDPAQSPDLLELEARMRKTSSMSASSVMPGEEFSGNTQFAKRSEAFRTTALHAFVCTAAFGVLWAIFGISCVYTASIVANSDSTDDGDAAVGNATSLSDQRLVPLPPWAEATLILTGPLLSKTQAAAFVVISLYQTTFLALLCSREISHLVDNIRGGMITSWRSVYVLSRVVENEFDLIVVACNRMASAAKAATIMLTIFWVYFVAAATAWHSEGSPIPYTLVGTPMLLTVFMLGMVTSTGSLNRDTARIREALMFEKGQLMNKLGSLSISRDLFESDSEFFQEEMRIRSIVERVDVLISINSDVAVFFGVRITSDVQMMLLSRGIFFLFLVTQFCTYLENGAFTLHYTTHARFA